MRRLLVRAPLLMAGLAGGTLLLSGCPAPSQPKGTTPASPVPSAAALPQFSEVSEAVGVRFKHHTGATGRLLMPESVGHGAAWFDYDRDGWLDLFLVNSSNWPGAPKSGATPVLYRNQGDGTFKDVTRAAGLAVPLYGMGCSVGDYDGDGDEDLLVTCLGPNRLFRNEGKRFVDATPGSGLNDGPRWAWHTSAAWFDYDRDGKPDLFVCRYVKWSPETDIPCRSGSGRRTYCGPEQYLGDRSDLYRNLGGGRFQNVSQATGIAGSLGKSLGVVPLDENGDGWTDLVVANDRMPNFLFRNFGGKRFEEVGQETGLAVGSSGSPRAGMGIDAADYRNDGGLAYAIGNFSSEGLALFDRQAGLYTDRATAAGLVPASLTRLTFGLAFLDADRDGWLDLLTGNGHVDPNIHEMGTGITFKEVPQLFRNERGNFRDISTAAGEGLQQPLVTRGLAVGDWDNDGRPDVVLCENGGKTRLLKNSTPDQNHWLGVRLIPSKGQSALGAEVRLMAGGQTQRRWVRAGGSYLSHSDGRPLFGLGGTQRAERLEVLWPSGSLSTVEMPSLDRYLEVRETEQP